MNDTPNQTAEQILWELYPDDVMDHNRRANCHLFLEQLRAHGLLSEGAPTEAQIERAARAIRADYVQRYPEEPPVYHAGAGQPVWRHMARAALVAAQGAASQEVIDDAADEQDDLRLHMLAPQEPSQNETKSGNNFVSLDPEKVADVLNDHDYMYSTSACKCLWTGPGSHQAHQSEALCEAYTEGKLT